jgi:hypothetical protein
MDGLGAVDLTVYVEIAQDDSVELRWLMPAIAEISVSGR